MTGNRSPKRCQTPFFRGLAAAALALAALASASAAPAPDPRDEAELARVEAYLDGIRTLAGRFVQVGPDGGVAEGRVYLRRPGRLRFEYAPPVPVLIVADGVWLVFYDSELGQVSRLPLSATPLAILVDDKVRLRGSASVRRVERRPGSLRITLVDPERRERGSLTLVLSDRPLALRSWVVTDAQGLETTVALMNVESNVDIDPALFVFNDPVDDDGH